MINLTNIDLTFGYDFSKMDLKYRDEIKTDWGILEVFDERLYFKENKSLISFHRFLFENFYNIKLPKNYFVHHINKNSLNNLIWNLQAVKENIHKKFHATGIKFTDKRKLNISKANSGKNNGMFGKKPWNKGIKKDNFSNWKNHRANSKISDLDQVYIKYMFDTSNYIGLQRDLAKLFNVSDFVINKIKVKT